MIPEGWKATTIGEHVEVLTGFAFKSAEYTSNEHDVKLLRGDNIAPHKLRWRDVKRFPKERAKEVLRYELRAGDFVVAMDRTWLPSGVKIAEVKEADLPCFLVQRVARLRARATLLQGLMKQFFSGDQFDQYVQAVQTETAVPHISPADLRDYPIKLPPLPEQRRIAEILSTWDRAIEMVEALIANARTQKMALMHALLTGQRRLPGFSGEWTACALEKVFEFLKGQGLSKDAVVEGGAYPCILYGELYTRYPEVIGEVVGRTDADEGIRSRAGDVLIPASTTTTGIDLANATALLQSDVRLSGDINILRPKDNTQSAAFFAYLLTHIKKLEIASRAQGSTIVHLYGSALKPLLVRFPKPDEQHAIAQVIRDADLEISRFGNQLAALRQEKSALMQQLLTGKRRVKIMEKVEA